MILRKLLSFSLVPALLWASMGFSISRHYCLGMLVEEHLYHSTEVCESKSAYSACHSESQDTHNTGNCQSETKGCCENIWLQIEGIDVISFADEKLGSTSKQSKLKPQLVIPELLLQSAIPNPAIALNELVFFKRKKDVQQYLAEIQRFLI